MPLVYLVSCNTTCPGFLSSKIRSKSYCALDANRLTILSLLTSDGLMWYKNADLYIKIAA